MNVFLTSKTSKLAFGNVVFDEMGQPIFTHDRLNGTVQMGPGYSLLDENGDPIGGGSVSEPANQIVYGTGSGVDSSANFTFDTSINELYITGTNGGSLYFRGNGNAVDGLTVTNYVTDDFQTAAITVNADSIGASGGTSGIFINASAANSDYVEGIGVQVRQTSGGSVGSLTAIVVASPQIAGTVTDAIGISVNNISGATNNYAIIVAAGTTGLNGVVAPTAGLHLGAGTTTVAPFKLNSGTNLTTPEAGAIEWDGTNLFVTQTTGPTRKTVAWTTDITGGSVATDAIWDAKGDLAVGTGANTAAKLTVGTNGMQLYAQSAESTGVKWGTTTISPAQITSDQDDYTPTDWAKSQIVRISGDNGIRAITSFAATFDGDEKTLINIGSYPVYIPSEHPDGTAANRVISVGDYILFPDNSVKIKYDATSSRWRLLNGFDYGEATLFYSWSAGSITAADYGDIAFTTSGTGASNTATAAGSGFPGHTLGSTGTTNAGWTGLYFAKGLLEPFYFGDAHTGMQAILQFPTLSDGTETYYFHCNVDAAPTGIQANGNPNANTIGIRYSSAINSGKFEGYSRNNAGSETTVDLGVTVAANTTYDLRVEMDKGNTEARFFVNRVAKGRVAATMPTAQSCAARMYQLKTAGTTARTIRYISLRSMSG